MPADIQRSIVIIGGGIIGCTSAYYLTQHPSFDSNTQVTILETSAKGAAQGASGKAGGLVAKWAYPREIVDVSFREHARLAKVHGGAERWGWREVGVGSWFGRGGLGQVESSVGSGRKRKSLEKTAGLDSHLGRDKKGLPDNLTWVSEDLTVKYEPMAGEGDTAQVHPYLFTTSMLHLAQEAGTKLVTGRATSIEHHNGSVTGVRYIDVDGVESMVPATHAIVAAGAWSPRIVPKLPLGYTRAHSVVIRTAPDVPIAPYALFTEIDFPNAKGSIESVSPEIYARPDGTVYACGSGDDAPLPESVDDVHCEVAACDAIVDQVKSISKELREGDVCARQACYLPQVTVGSGPIIGEAVKVARGLIIATGHTCWGICNAPGTAKAVTELIMEGGISCADLNRLSPARFLP
jgi:glycine/D-amino acid oxidase-like deaminating enzyme